MAAKTHIANDQSLTLGAEVFDGTRHAIPFIEPSPTGSNVNDRLVNTGNTAINTTFPANHQSYNSLPLSHVNVRPYGPSKVIGAAVYARSQYSPSRFPAFEMAHEVGYRAGRRTTRTYPAEGYTHVNDTDPNPAIWYKIFATQTQWFSRNKIQVTTILAEHPKNIMESNSGVAWNKLINTINSDTFVINGIERKPFTLRLLPVQVEPFDARTTIKYRVTYEIEEDLNTWFGRRNFLSLFVCSDLLPSPVGLPWCLTADSGITMHRTETATGKSLFWQGIEFKPSYDQIPWNGLFPTHGSPNGYNQTTPGSGGRFLL
jgi:hypothetical protein